tara:strand:- start:1003 stop:1653 length:651 start_codon:yes stop_codon:yes gene_type:complete
MKAKINVPTNLSEITLRQYQEFLTAQETNEDEHYLEHKAIEIFCHVPEEKIKTIAAHSVTEIANKISALFADQKELVRFFTLNKKEFGFIPNLDEISFGEYIDIDTYLSDWKNMHYAMNVLYRPISHKKAGRYDLVGYDTEQRDRALQMPMNAVLGSIFFLFNLRKDLLKTTLNSLAEEVEIQQVHLPHLDKNGGGTIRSMDLVKETLNELSQSLR